MAQTDYAVSVDIAAKGKMLKHVRFLTRVNISAAGRLRNAYYDALKSLESNPQRCPLYKPNNSIGEELRYLLFSERYRVVFGIVGKAVFVYDIQDARQNVDKNLV